MPYSFTEKVLLNKKPRMNPAAYPADFPIGPGEQRNHNKKRRQDEDPPDSGGLPPSETTASPAQPPSYKDTLLGD
ncbi:hypothetical protein V6N12_072846 [Hibiscus sabdariffa]|uniref:Uncharacterized protein n=1 Tax=Hibiscus sabdariffa TaxID=183260 RepID=A0ABR2AYH4_9ROSI